MSEEYLKRKRQYVHKYNVQHYRTITFLLKKEDADDEAIYSFLKSKHGEMGKLIRELIVSEMKKEGK